MLEGLVYLHAPVGDKVLAWTASNPIPSPNPNPNPDQVEKRGAPCSSASLACGTAPTPPRG